MHGPDNQPDSGVLTKIKAKANFLAMVKGAMRSTFLVFSGNSDNLKSC